MDKYTVVLDTSQYQGGVLKKADYTGKIGGIIIRLNGVWPQIQGSALFYKDTNFNSQWAECGTWDIPRSPYFVFSPFHSGQENYNFLLANCPAGVKTVFIDVEIKNPSISIEELTKRLNDFYVLAKQKWFTVIYTGGGFADYVSSWPEADYWWSKYPDSMYPPVKITIDWPQLNNMIKALSWSEPVDFAMSKWKISGIRMWQCTGDRLILPGNPNPMDVSVFPGTKEEYAYWIENGGKMNVLKVPYISQLLSGALSHNNDCGPTSALMVARAYNVGTNFTVDSFYDSMQPSGDVGISVAQLQTALSKLGVKTEWKVDLKPTDIFVYLTSGKPMIALIHYGTLVDAKLTEKTAFRGAHYVVVTGIDIFNVNIKDPYRDDGVADVAVPILTFVKAWQEASLDGNPTNGAITPLLNIQDLSVVVPVGQAYVLATGINGLNVRALPTSSSTLLRTIWRVNGVSPVIHVIATAKDSYNQSWSQISEGGWVFTQYIIPQAV